MLRLAWPRTGVQAGSPCWLVSWGARLPHGWDWGWGRLLKTGGGGYFILFQLGHSLILWEVNGVRAMSPDRVVFVVWLWKAGGVEEVCYAGRHGWGWPSLLHLPPKTRRVKQHLSLIIRLVPSGRHQGGVDGGQGVQIAVVNFAPWHSVGPLFLFERGLEAAFSLVWREAVNWRWKVVLGKTKQMLFPQGKVGDVCLGFIFIFYSVSNRKTLWGAPDFITAGSRKGAQFICQSVGTLARYLGLQVSSPLPSPPSRGGLGVQLRPRRGWVLMVGSVSCQGGGLSSLLVDKG